MSGLTFAVVWGPDDEIVTFSGAELLDPSDDDDNMSLDSPTDAYDNRSQVLSVGHSTHPFSETTATLACFRDNHDFLFRSQTPVFDRVRRARHTQTSSTMEGFDVYLRGSLLGQAHNTQGRYSCLEDLDSEFPFNPLTSFARLNYSQKEARSSVSDEGFFEDDGATPPRPLGVEVNLVSCSPVLVPTQKPIAIFYRVLLSRRRPRPPRTTSPSLQIQTGTLQHLLGVHWKHQAHLAFLVLSVRNSSRIVAPVEDSGRGDLQTPYLPRLLEF